MKGGNLVLKVEEIFLCNAAGKYGEIVVGTLFRCLIQHGNHLHIGSFFFPERLEGIFLLGASGMYQKILKWMLSKSQ